MRAILIAMRTLRGLGVSGDIRIWADGVSTSAQVPNLVRSHSARSQVSRETVGVMLILRRRS